MREMWVNPEYFDKKSFGCFDRLRHSEGAVYPVVVLTKQEYEEINRFTTKDVDEIIRLFKERQGGGE